MTGKIQNAVKTKADSLAKSEPKTMQDYIKKMEGEIAKALPSVITPERFTRIVLSALSTTPKLAETTPSSFLGAMMTAAQLGLEPNTPLGQAYLIPFRNNKKGVMECQFQLGYKGLIDLAYRSGQVNIIQAHTVHENDEFKYELGLDPILKHIPAKTNRGDVIYYYAIFKTKDGGNGFSVMSVEDVKNHAKAYSKTFNNGPWQTNFDEMAKKTVLKQALKYAPLKTDFLRTVSADESIREVDSDTAIGISKFEDSKLVYADYEVNEDGELISDIPEQSSNDDLKEYINTGEPDFLEDKPE